MALQKQLVEFPLWGGVDEGLDSKVVPPTSLADVVNFRTDKQGALKRRQGYATQTKNKYGGSSVAALYGLGRRKQELLGTDQHNVYTRFGVLWGGRGSLSEVQLVSRQPVGRDDNHFIVMPAVAITSSGTMMVAYSATDNGLNYDKVVAVLMRADTGTIVEAEHVVVSTNSPRHVRVTTDGSDFIVWWNEAGTNKIRGAKYDTSTNIWGAATDHIASTHSSGHFDVIYTGSKYHLVHWTGASLAFGDYSDLGATATTAILQAAANFQHLATQPLQLDEDDSHVWAAWLETSTTVKACAYDPTAMGSGLSLAATTVSSSSGVTSVVSSVALVQRAADEMAVQWGQDDTSGFGTEFTKWRGITHAGTLDTNTLTQFCVTPAAKPFYNSSSGRMYSTVQGPLRDESVQRSYFLLELRQDDDGFTTGRVACKWAPNEASKITAVSGIPRVASYDGDIYVPSIVSTKGAGEIALATKSLYELDLVRLTYDFQRGPYPNVEAHGAAYLAGGCVEEYAGTAHEAGFHWYPEVELSVSAGSGALSAGTYLVSWTYEWQDQEGRRHVSAPSPAQSITVSANDRIAHEVQNLTLTQKSAPELEGQSDIPVTLCLWRTTVNSTGPFYRVLDFDDAPTNQRGAATQTYTEGVADSAITSKEQLYTRGGVLDNIAPPSPKLIARHGNRVWVVSAEHPTRVYFSKQGTLGEAIAWNDGLYVDVPEEVTAIESLDSALVLWTERRVYAVYGDGPNDAGGGQPFSQPQILTSDTGCTEPRSLAVIPPGIMFRGQAGYYLLTRGRTVEFLGAPVEDTLDGVTINATLVRPKLRTVEIPLSTGVWLVYDYDAGKWTRFTMPESAIATDLTEYSGEVWWVSPTSAEIYKEAGDYDDKGGPYVSSVTTPWYHLAGLNGFQRVRRVHLLGEFATAENLSVEIWYDYKTAAWDTRSWTKDELNALQDHRLVFRPPRQKCQAIRFKFSTTGAELSEGFSLTGLALEVGTKGGSKLQAGAKR